MSARVLIVEDDDIIREFVSIALRGVGYDVTTASHGAAALDIVNADEPGLILLDMRMPVMDGWQFSRLYREFPAPRAPVIVVTAAQDARETAAGVAHVTGLFCLVHDRSHEGAEPANAHQALAHFRGEIAFFTDPLQQLLEIRAALTLIGVKYPFRGVIDDLADALEMVGGAVDDGFEQADQQARPVDRPQMRLHRSPDEYRERLRVMVAHRDQKLAAVDCPIPKKAQVFGTGRHNSEGVVW